MPSSPLVTRLTALLVAALLCSPQAHAENKPRVVTSLKPLELLVQAVAADQVEVTTLVPSGSSPHTYQLRPSERRELAAADLIFWVGPGMENFLNRLLTGPDFRDRTVALATRENEAHDDHGHDQNEHLDDEHHQHEESGDDHDHGHHDDHGDEHSHDDDNAHDSEPHDGESPAHDHGHNHGEGEDPHIWLDPALALAMARDIAEHLKELDGVDEAAIDARLAGFTGELNATETAIREQLMPARQLDLFTYHDAFRRFAEHYGLTIAGVLTLSPERTPGARHLAEVQERLNSAPQPCLLTEPQFNRQWWDSLMTDVDVPVSTWDPLAGDIGSSPQGYLMFQQGLADAVLECLPEYTQQ